MTKQPTFKPAFDSFCSGCPNMNRCAKCGACQYPDKPKTIDTSKPPYTGSRSPQRWPQ